MAYSINGELLTWKSQYKVRILCLLKVVSYYELTILSMSVMGFQKIGWGWVGGRVELYI